MKDFDNLKAEWKKRTLPEAQENGYKEIIQRGKYIRRKQTIGQVVLTATIVILVAFFFYISAYQHAQVSLGLMVMIGSLIIRVVIEFIFKLKASNLPFTHGQIEFNHAVVRYYKSRWYLNYLITPLLFVTYIVGFNLLLPSFKENLSAGFYTYIVYSSWIIFGLLALFIFVQIKKELKNITDLSPKN